MNVLYLLLSTNIILSTLEELDSLVVDGSDTEQGL